MIDYILVAILSTQGIEFDSHGIYKTFSECIDAKESLRELDGVDIVVSVCIRRETKWNNYQK